MRHFHLQSFLVLLTVFSLISACQQPPAVVLPTNAMNPTSPKPTASPFLPATQTPTASQQAAPTATEVEAVARLKGMSLEEKIGQVMVIGFDGLEMSDPLREMIVNYHVGGVILFARNVESPAQVAHLVNQLQQAALESNHPGLLIAIDQEGGRVARLTEDKGFTEFPGAMAIAATGEPENARLIYQAIASELKALGINANFAPDLDVNNNPLNPVIGLRSFGSDPLKVAEFGVAAVQGLQDSGVMAFGKHFPGHGDTSVDSHVNLPEVAHARDRLESVEFVPFEAAMGANVAGIMSAHVTFPAIDTTKGMPATLSGPVLTGLLREEMGYQGLLITDSLEMGALAEIGFPVYKAAPTALQAGADLLLFNRDHRLHKLAINEVAAWVGDGRIPETRLDEAVTRVLEAKARFGLLNPQPVDENAAVDETAQPDHRQLSRDIALGSVTLLTDKDALLPLSSDDNPIVIGSWDGGLSRIISATFIPVSQEPKQGEILNAVAACSDGRKAIVLTNDANLSEAQIELVRSLIDAGVPVIWVAQRNPYDLLALPDVGTYMLTYGSNPPAIEALAVILLGNAQPRGHLPVDLPGLFPAGSGLTEFVSQ